MQEVEEGRARGARNVNAHLSSVDFAHKLTHARQRGLAARIVSSRSEEQVVELCELGLARPGDAAGNSHACECGGVSDRDGLHFARQQNSWEIVMSRKCFRYIYLANGLHSILYSEV